MNNNAEPTCIPGLDDWAMEGSLNDIGATHELLADGQTVCCGACLANNAKKKSRRDFVLATRLATTRIDQFRVNTNNYFTVHDPVGFRVNGMHEKHIRYTLRQPKSMDEDWPKVNEGKTKER